MASFSIRQYEHRDYDAARHVFVQVRPEVVPATFRHVLTRRKTHLILLCIFSSLLLCFESFLLSIIAIVCFLCLYHLLLYYLIQRYIQQSLREDLMDIDKSYIQASGSGFWVAEIGEKIGGIVAAYPADDSHCRTRLTLRRLAVLKEQRGSGIGKALCRTVIDFARQNGYKEIVLNSAMVYNTAHTLFKSVGFQKIERRPVRKMASVCIRKYEHRDYDAVRYVFAQVRPEVIPATFHHVLKRSKTHLMLLCIFSSVLLCFESFLLSVIAIVCFLCSYCLLLYYLIQRYIQQSLREDLMDIDKSYIQVTGSCFWVAEIGEKVVGIVAAYPADDSDSKTCLMLKRLAALNDHKGCGIGKALCRAVIDFARKNGYKEIVLYSAMVHNTAHRLYESMGFQKISEHKQINLFGRITNFKMFQFRYEIKQDSDMQKQDGATST